MNKKNILKGVLAGFLLVASLTSCDDYLDVNTDPNNPTVVSPNLILPVGQTYTAFYMHGDRRASHLGNMLMYNWSESHGFSWYNDEFQYLVTTTFYQSLFDQAYTRALKQYHILTQLGPEDANYAAIGKIMKAYHFQLLVDFYGDIPYFQALGRSEVPTPAYDAASAVYDDLLLQLDEAIELIKAAEEDPLATEVGNDDVMFQGNMTNWIRFANTLKVRILTRISGKSVATTANASKISTELSKIAEEGTGFITTDVLLNPGYTKEENKQNPLYDSFGKGPDGTDRMNFRATAATQYILTYLTQTRDPRIGKLYEEEEGGFVGVDQIAEPTSEFGYADVSNIGPGLLKDPTQSANIFTLAEHHFNLAELALKGLYAGDAQTLYENGVKASFAYLGVPAIDALDYLGNIFDEGEDPDDEEDDTIDRIPNTGVKNTEWASAGTDEERLEAIITQKWLGVNGITAEQSWFDFTRTGFPKNLPIPEEAQTIGKRPVRLFYPSSERSSNAANVPAQPDAFNSPIFWAN